MNFIFGSIMENGTMTGATFFAATAVSLLIGLFLALIYMKQNSYSKSFVLTLVLLPAIVQLVIMLVNGNIGAGVAVAGAFSLVRFRSAAGSGQEITAVFLAMACGLATGMGYLCVALMFAGICGSVGVLITASRLADGSSDERILKITIPENLDFEGVFDDVLDKYTGSAELTEVRTVSMGSLYRLNYHIRLLQGVRVKDLMDVIRTRNGNLEVSCGRPAAKAGEL